MGRYNDKKKSGDAPIDQKEDKEFSGGKLWLIHPDRVEYFVVLNHIPFQSNREIFNQAAIEGQQQVVEEYLTSARLITTEYISSNSSRGASDNDEIPLFAELSPSPTLSSGEVSPFIAALTGVDSIIAVKG